MFSGYCSRNSRSAAIDSEQKCGHTRIELNYYELDASFDYSCTSMHGQPGQSQSAAKLTPRSPRNSSDRGVPHRQFALHFSAVVCSVDRQAPPSRGLVSLGSLAFLLIINNPNGSAKKRHFCSAQMSFTIYASLAGSLYSLVGLGTPTNMQRQQIRVGGFPGGFPMAMWFARGFPLAPTFWNYIHKSQGRS